MAQGSRAFALPATVIETCRKRNVCPWKYLAEVIAARRRGQDAPALPQTNVSRDYNRMCTKKFSRDSCRKFAASSQGCVIHYITNLSGS